MNKHNILSRAEMKNIHGGGCPGWYQAQCLAEASNQSAQSAPDEEDIVFNLILEQCMREWDNNPFPS